jgi:hypothetical protein
MQLRKKVDFKTNLPVQVALAYDDGILKQDGRYGDYWIYTLDDERVMFVPPAVHNQIKSLHITRGQKFIVTKQEKRVGHKRAIEWLVGFPGDEAEPSVSAAQPGCLPRTLPDSEAQGSLLQETIVPAGIAEPAQAEPKQIDLPPPPANGHAAEHGPAGALGTNAPPAQNGAIKPNGAATQPNGHAPATEKTNTSPLFRASMRAAIDALIDAEQYAAKRDYCIRFTSEDLRATAISIFIAARDGSSR